MQFSNNRKDVGMETSLLTDENDLEEVRGNQPWKEIKKIQEREGEKRA